MILYINACVREQSRTKRIADKLIEKMEGKVEQLDLVNVPFPVVDEAFLRKRDALIGSKEYDDPLFDLARQFAGADEIVIAAPFWDLSFPSILKVYIEKLCVNNLTFKYENNKEYGLCKLSKFMLIATSGGERIDNKLNYLFDIIDFLSSKNVKKYYSYVNGLDMMDDSNCKGVIKKAIKDFDKIICEI